jgi:hypothetical protein
LVERGKASKDKQDGYEHGAGLCGRTLDHKGRAERARALGVRRGFSGNKGRRRGVLGAHDGLAVVSEGALQ